MKDMPAYCYGICPFLLAYRTITRKVEVYVLIKLVPLAVVYCLELSKGQSEVCASLVVFMGSSMLLIVVDYCGRCWFSFAYAKECYDERE